MTLIATARRTIGLLPFLLACLPVDDRPPPARVVVAVTVDQNLAEGITTTDGWSIRYDRFLVSLGAVSLDPPSSSLGPPSSSPPSETSRCTEYAPAFYVRILDLLKPSPQTLRTAYGLGECTLRFELGDPGAFSSLVSNVDEDVERFMREPRPDAFAFGGIVLSVAGTATRAGTTLSFDWSFRQAFGYETCDPISLEGDASWTFEIQIQSRFLFHDRLDHETAQVVFDPYAAADGNGDGQITLEELGQVPVSDGTEFATLAERLYLGLVPQLPWFQGQPPCVFYRFGPKDPPI